MKYAVCAVLKKGGVYNAQWVYRWMKQVQKNMPKDCEMVCLTDMQVDGIKTYPLKYNLPGFWSKIELFRPGIFSEYEKVLFLDLDILVRDKLQPFFDATNEFSIAYVEDVGRYKPERKIGYQSSVMCWKPGKRDAFFNNFTFGHMDSWYGDQDLLKFMSPNEDTFPKEWVLKLEAPWLGEKPPDHPAKILLCIRPKNNDLAANYLWIRESWGNPF